MITSDISPATLVSNVGTFCILHHLTFCGPASVATSMGIFSTDINLGIDVLPIYICSGTPLATVMPGWIAGAWDVTTALCKCCIELMANFFIIPRCAFCRVVLPTTFCFAAVLTQAQDRGLWHKYLTTELLPLLCSWICDLQCPQTLTMVHFCTNAHSK